MSLSQLHKKQLEEFDEMIENWMFTKNPEKSITETTKSYLTQSTLSTLQGVWEMLEEQINASRIWFRESERGVTFCVACMENYYCVHEIKIEALTDTQKKIEEEIIKIKENV